MALTATEQLYNKALGIVGEYTVTEGLTAEEQYVLCDRYYVDSRDEILAMHSWNEATKDVVILRETSVPLFGYNYKYALPSDCIVPQSIGTDTYKWTVRNGYILTDFIIEPEIYNDGSVYYEAGQYISYSDVTYLVDTAFTSSAWTTDASYCTTKTYDYGYIELTYTYQLTDIDSFSPHLLNCICINLAIKIISKITNTVDSDTKLYLERKLREFALPDARWVDSVSGGITLKFNSNFLKSRG